MLSAMSDNSATNRLIDLLGMDEINSFMEEHNYKARKAQTVRCWKKTAQRTTHPQETAAVSSGASMKRPISTRMLRKRLRKRCATRLPGTGIRFRQAYPEDVDTANKTGELFTTNSEGVSVDVQNDAAIIYAKDHPYILVVIIAGPRCGRRRDARADRGEYHAEVYKAVTDAESEEVSSKEAATEEAAVEGTSKEAATEAAAEEGTSKEAATEEGAAKGTSKGAASEEGAAKGTSR